MLNEELFFDKKDLEIAKLKQSIDRFKKYDKNRNKNHKKEISELKIEIGKLKSYIEELESDKDLEKLKTRIKNQKEVIVDLRRKLHITEKQLEKFYI
jgi:ppGpp synthetase/RelA/SpoT-type nucleotidyltranferase